MTDDNIDRTADRLERRRQKHADLLWKEIEANLARVGDMSEMDWCCVLNELQGRVISLGLRRELSDASDDGR